ncbi:MAG: hypothetical protein ABI603_00795 [Acidobacteriota bacterium]
MTETTISRDYADDHDRLDELFRPPPEAGLLEVLAAHNWKEEHILYPRLDQEVTAEKRRQVFLGMAAPE